MLGLIEVAIFHPWDTVSKRLMNSTSHDSFKYVIFREATDLSTLKKFQGLYRGLQYGFFFLPLIKFFAIGFLS